MAMSIGLIAPPWVPVPPSIYGGTELVVDELARGLVASGCEVLLFATGDSTCPVPVRWVFPRALGTTADPSAELAHVEAAYEALQGVDVIHDHTALGPLWAARHRVGTPVVSTVHGELVPDVCRSLVVASQVVDVVAISQSQRRSAPDVRFAAVIHHGIELDRLQPGDGRGGYVVFLGRFSPAKGAHRAIDVARRAGRPIVLAAKMWEPLERAYFAEVIRPMLADDAVYVGPVDHARKVELLGGAEALLNPIRWPEPFGLVMIESLACGTPVLSFAEGAAPEIVEDGVTGFLCRDERDMAAKLGHVAALDRGACRRAVEARFSTARMVADHLRLYRRVLRTSGLATRR